MPCCTIFHDCLTTCACASRPDVSCWITFIIIHPTALCLLIIIKGDCSLTACGRCRIASGRWGRLVGENLYSCTERHTFRCISNLCGRAWHIHLFSRGDTCIFPKWVTCAFFNNAFLDEFLVFCVELCGLMVWKDLSDLGPSLCWTCMCAFTASRSGELVCWRPWLAGVKSIW